VSPACAQFRDAWWSGERAEDHARTCAECARWQSGVLRREQALRELVRIAAPLELEARLARELSGRRVERLERVLGSLSRFSAPPELDERFGLTPSAEPENGRDGNARVVGALELHSAPNVLDRLVEEELAAPARHRSERFAGGLARLSAPPELARRLDTSARRRRWVRLVLVPAATLAAAALIVWIGVLNEPAPRARRFQVVHATSLDQLDPLARALAESLAGASRQ
jgi:hypothetical protein